MIRFFLYQTMIAFFLSSQALAAPSTALLRDVGVIGLMSHDIFAWDRENEVNTENGRLDLSTIFDHDGGKLWEKGGNPKNCENSPVCTITMQLVESYKNELKKSSGADDARKRTVLVFQAMVKDSFQRLSSLPLPVQAKAEPVNNVEQASLRAMHDLLPGTVTLYNRPFFKSLDLTNALFAKLQLNEDELNQELRPFDGDYDAEYKTIKIPFTDVVLNLMEIDRKFIEEHSPYRQADMLAELAAVGRGEKTMQEVSFIHHVADILAKGLCAEGNPWMAAEIPCVADAQ